MDPVQIGELVGTYGFPIVSSGLLLYLVYYIWKFITEQIEPLIEEMHMTTCNVLGIRPDTERIARAKGKIDARND